MTTRRLSFIDWMKCLGILLIVLGHITRWDDPWLPPIYPKQLGVAFFLFVTAYTLARETRSGKEILFKRLFEVYFFGIGFALMISCINVFVLGRNEVNESNYLPFLLGSNVVFNFFPANPTTWFIGTYTHLIVIWVLLLRRLQVRPWMLAATVVMEILVRSVLTASAGLYIAYMTFPNWASVFLLGLYLGQRGEEPSFHRFLPSLLGLGLLAVLWGLFSGQFAIESSFPFSQWKIGPPPVDLIITSASITFLYTMFTLLTYQATRQVSIPAIVQFFARNTLIIFLVHMPIMYAMRIPLGRWTSNYPFQVGVLAITCLVLPALASDLIARAIRPTALRDGLWRWVSRTRLREPGNQRAAAGIDS